jgi:glycosyltransferase involved in cell wall biosynthesis
MNSRFETFSLICAEAMSCGKPVLATRCGGPDDFVTGETGILIEPDNDLQLRDNFRHMLFHYGDYDSEMVKRHAEQYFSAGIVSEGFDKMYDAVMKQRRR